MAKPSAAETVLGRFGVSVSPGDRLEPLGNAGGFSGARFWRLERPHRPLCLRRWPREHSF